MKKISVLINSRIESNPNCGLINLLKSMADCTKYLDQVEVLVKFDTCDPLAPETIARMKKIPIDTKHIIEPRGRGYTDIHHGYNRLLMHISPDVELIGAMADDFLVYAGWDEAMISLMSPRELNELYIVHQRPHPPTCRENYASEKFYMQYPMFQEMEHLFIVDECPFWSRELLFTTTWMGAGLSFTDGWTIALEYVLWNQYKINITRFVDDLWIHRVTHPGIDTSNSPRWNTDRRLNFEYVASPYFREVVEHQARNVYLNLKERAK